MLFRRAKIVFEIIKKKVLYIFKALGSGFEKMLICTKALFKFLKNVFRPSETFPNRSFVSFFWLMHLLPEVFL